ISELPPLGSLLDPDDDYDDNNAILSRSTREEGVDYKMVRGRKRSEVLELEEIQKHFNMPITKAAREMKIGLTLLKKRCRELNIMRWPHRKIKSLNSLINSFKEQGLLEEMRRLEEQQRFLHNFPDADLTESINRLRQACAKDNYKRRRTLAALSN
ncbi:hypothetical protein Tsubulata_015089, partial [Turnera subulata]